MSRSRRSRGEQHESSLPTRAIIVAARPSDVDDGAAQRSVAELEQLLGGLGVRVEHRIIQRRGAGPTYLGEGKLREVAALTGGPGIVPRGPAAPEELRGDLVVVADDELSPAQQRSLEAALAAEVLDRTAVILRVFEARARTREAKIEIALARLEYELPRIRDDRSLGDREGGGGRAARGNSNVELAKQRIRERAAALRRELESAASGERRGTRDALFRVALVGYTNAGKSSLMRGLTGSDVLVEDKLFATLLTTVRRLVPPARPPIVVADTVGFLERLPHCLVASFRSTLAEARDAWLLLHVVDASDGAFRGQMAVTNEVLADIRAGGTPTLLVLNKADRLEARARAALAEEYPEALVLSAHDEADVARLRARIDAFFAGHVEERTFDVPYARLAALADLRDLVDVVAEEFGETVSLTVRGAPVTLARIAARLRPS